MNEGPEQEKAVAKPKLYRIQSQSNLISLERPVSQQGDAVAQPGDKAATPGSSRGSSRRSKGRPRGASRQGLSTKAKTDDLCKKCSANFAKVQTAESESALPPLHYAAYHGHYDCLDWLLTQLLASKESAGSSGKTEYL